MDNWFASLIKKSDFHIEWIPLSESHFWCIKNGRIVHRSGRFFKIIGLANQPFIDQNEIGTLGFLLREGKQKKEILVQAKIEPGNSHIVQLAPTCQATKSNTLMVHGGKEPPFSHLFTQEHPQMISSTLQSEQGTRFFKKRNRNILAISLQRLYLPDSHRWISIDRMLRLLSKDYLVNTDARSVLVCSPWNKLVDRVPFSRLKINFANELENSYKQNIETHQFENMKKKIISMQQKEYSARSIPLEELNDWKITDLGIEPLQKKSFRVRYIKVTAKTREVPEWDQPIIDSYNKGRVDLICGRINKVLYFYFKIIIEPGLYNYAELSPATINRPKAKIIKSVLQSDEGGRFYRDITRYRIIDIGEVDLTLPGYWLNLAQVQNLLLKNGWFTNEARSAISLLLCWL